MAGPRLAQCITGVAAHERRGITQAFVHETTHTAMRRFLTDVRARGVIADAFLVVDPAMGWRTSTGEWMLKWMVTHKGQVVGSPTWRARMAEVNVSAAIAALRPAGVHLWRPQAINRCRESGDPSALWFGGGTPAPDNPCACSWRPPLKGSPPTYALWWEQVEKFAACLPMVLEAEARS